MSYQQLSRTTWHSPQKDGFSIHTCYILARELAPLSLYGKGSTSFCQNQAGEPVLPFNQASKYQQDSLLFYHNYKQQMDIKKAAIIGAGAIGLLIAGLFIKNVISEKSMEQLSKEQVVRILRLIRKERYLVYKQIATFAISIMQQMRGNINQQAIEQFLNGPECPFKYEEESEKIYIKVCEDNKTTVDAFNFTLEKLSKDPEIIQLLDQQQLDYKTTLSGKVPIYEVKVPSSITKEKFYQLQNQITKAVYMHQVRLFKLLQKHSEIEIQTNPAILKELGSPEAANEEMLREEGLGTEFEPANAVYDAASLQFRNHPDFQRKIQSIETGYQKILMKYVQRIQTKSITDAELNQLEEEIIYFQPI